MKSIKTVLVGRLRYKKVMYTEKQIIMSVQAAPKIQPSGVQGAFSSSKYHVDCAPFPIKRAPNPSAPKFNTIKAMSTLKNLKVIFFEVVQFVVESFQLQHIFYHFHLYL